jgi:iron complex outermembrane receptor protein
MGEFMKLTKMKVAVFSALAAQAGFMADTAIAQSNEGIEEIIITATRRETDVQDVPLAVTALTGDSLEDQNIENLEDLTGVVPNVLIAGGNGGTTSGSFYMRGIPNVGVYLDGIWQVSNNGLLTRDFVELDRVEVLRGPQGTLYGRDSTGGSIHMHSKRPSEEFGVSVKAGVGNLDRRDLMVSMDLPLGDNLRSKWTVGSYEQDGWIKSLTTGDNAGWMDSQVFRGDIEWTPTDSLTFRLIHQEDDQVGQQARVQSRIDNTVADVQGFQMGIARAVDIASGGKFNPNYAVAGYPGGTLGKWESRLSSTVPNEQYLRQTTVHADWDINDTMHLKYMYGRTTVDASIYNDWGGSEYNFFVNYDTSKLNLESHEVQLTGSLLDDSLFYTLGYYNWEQESRNRGVEWGSADWTFAADNNGTTQTLDWQAVLDSPYCSDSPSDRGLTFPGDVWPQPCGWLGNIIGAPFAAGWGWAHAFAGPGSASNQSDRLNGQNQDGDAYFGELTYNINDAWDVTVGYRHHEQDNMGVVMSDAHFAAQIASGVTEARPDELNTLFASRGDAVAGTFDVFNPTSFSANTWRFATTYDITEDLMIYGGYSEGFNSGGVSQYEDSLGPVEIFYDPEVIENWELGLRSDLLDGALRANVTYFSTDWLGIQYLGTVIDRVSGTEATELVLQNTANGNAEGLEFELTYLPTDRLTLTANLGFLDTKYTSINPGAPLPQDSEFARAPETTYMLSAEYEFDNVFGGSLMTRVQANYWDSYWRASTLELRQNFQGLISESPAGDLWMTNARAVWTPRDGDYSITLWGNNLTNEYNFNSGFMHGVWQFDFATVDRPREFGLSIDASF